MKVFAISLSYFAFSYRYEEKRWIPRDGQAKSPPRRQDEKASDQWQRHGEKSGHGYSNSSENLFEEKKHVQTSSTKDNIPATRISIPVPPKGPEQVFLICFFLVDYSHFCCLFSLSFFF